MNFRSRTVLSSLFPIFAFLVVTAGGSAYAGLGLVGVTITSTETSPTNASPIPITFTFADEVQNFAIGDITPTNGTLSNFAATSTSVYTVDITPTADGGVQVDIAEGAGERISDPTDLTEVGTFSIVYDGTAPTPTITTPVNPTAASPIPVTVTFDEDVTGFDLTDVSVSNGTTQNLTPVSASQYTFEIVPTATGNVTVDCAANGVMDLAGNNNVAAGQLIIAFDSDNPTFTITIVQRGDHLAVTIEFNEDVTGFDSTDITIGNGTLANFAAVSASIYTLEIVSLTDSPITIDIADMAAIDLTGNTSFASSANFDVPSVPDLALGKKSNSRTHKGGNNYSSARFTETGIAGKAKYFASFQNDSIVTETFRASSRKNKSFDVKFRALGGGGNITTKIMTGRYTVELEPGAAKVVSICVSPNRPTTRVATFKDLIKLFSTRTSASDKGKVSLQFRGTGGLVPGTVGGGPLP